MCHMTAAVLSTWGEKKGLYDARCQHSKGNEDAVTLTSLCQMRPQLKLCNSQSVEHGTAIDATMVYVLKHA